MDIGHFDEDLTHGARLHHLHGRFKVLGGDFQVFKFFCADLLIGVHARECPAKSMHRRLFYHQSKVCSDKSVGGVCILFQLDVLGQRDVSCMDLQDLAASVFVRDTDLDLTVEPSAAAKCRVDGVGEVGCGDHDDFSAAL